MELKAKGIDFEEIQGVYQGVEQGPSYLIITDKTTALNFGQDYGQESVLTNEGLVYSNGTSQLAPSVHPRNVVGEAARKEDYHSTFEDGRAFSMGLDFENVTLTAPFDKTVYHGTPHEFPAEVEVIHTDTGRREFLGLEEELPSDVTKGLRDGTIIVRNHPNGRFSLDKIGSGEGNQTYGWGLYFAEQKGVAQYYKKMLSRGGRNFVKVGGAPVFDGQDFGDAVADANGTDTMALAHQTNSFFNSVFNHMNQGRTLNAAIALAKGDTPRLSEKMALQAASMIAKAKVDRRMTSGSEGKLLTVNIKADDADFLDHDEVVSAEHWARLGPAIAKIEGRFGKGFFKFRPTGQKLYSALEAALGAKSPGQKAKEASLFLKDLGFKGIVYDDGTSRDIQEGAVTHNHVVFDDEMVEIEGVEDRTGDMRRRRNQAAAAGLAAGQTPSFESPNDPTMASIAKTGLAQAVLSGEGWSDIATSMRRHWQDNLIDIRNVQRAAMQGIGRGVNELSDVYRKASIIKGKIGAKMKDLAEGEFKPVIAEMKRLGLSQGQLDDMLYAEHAEERNKSMQAINPKVTSGSGMTDAEAQKIKATMTIEHRALTSRVRRIIRRHNEMAWEHGLISIDNAIQFGLISKTNAVSQGLRSQAEVNAIPDPWLNYVPLQGWEGEEASGSIGNGQGHSVAGKEFKQALGRDSKADGPLAHIFNDAARTIIRSERNEVGVSFWRLVQDNPNPGLWAVAKPTIQRYVSQSTGLVVTRYMPDPNSRAEHIFSVKFGGKERHIEIYHSGLAQALKQLDVEDLGAALGLMMRGTRFLASVNTSLSPEWFVSNALRDIQTALVQLSDEDVKGIRTKVLAGVLSGKAALGAGRMLARSQATDAWTKAAYEFERAGGRVNFIDFNSVDDYRRQIESQLATGPLAAARRLGGAVLNGIDLFTSSIENGTRVAVFKALREAGYSAEKAASVAREITVNFNRRGNAGPFFNALYMFFNASIQGNVRLLQSLKRSNTAKMIAGGFLLWGLLEPIIAESMGGDDDDWYGRIPDYIRERNLIIPTGKGKDGYVTIPLPYGLNLAKVIGAAMTRTYKGHMKPTEGMASILSSIVNVANPLGGGNIVSALAPTLLDPFVQSYANTNDFNRQISPNYPGDERPDSEKAFKNASTPALNIAHALNFLTGGDKYAEGALSVSPNMLDFWYRSTFGGLGASIKDGVDTVVNWSDKEWSDVPFARKVYGEASTDRALASGYFELRDRVDNTNWQRKQRSKDQAVGGMDWLKGDRAREMKIAPVVKNAEKQLSVLKKRRKAIEDNTEMSSESQREALNSLRLQELRIEGAVMKRWAQTKE